MSITDDDVRLPERWSSDSTFHTPGVWSMAYRDKRKPRDPVLDYPSDPHPFLNALMDHAILRLMLLANGAVMPLSERVTSTRCAKAPGTYNGADVDRLARKFYQARTHRSRLLIIKAAQEKAAAFAHSPDRSMIKGTVEWKKHIADDLRPYRTLARVYGISLRDVTAYKKQYAVALPALRETQRYRNVQAVAA